MRDHLIHRAYKPAVPVALLQRLLLVMFAPQPHESSQVVTFRAALKLGPSPPEPQPALARVAPLLKCCPFQRPLATVDFIPSESETPKPLPSF